MAKPKKVFMIIAGLGVGLGAVVGLVNLVAPDAVSVSLNDKNVEGMTALWTSLLSSAIPGIIFGLIGAGIAAIFSRKKNTD